MTTKQHGRYQCSKEKLDELVHAGWLAGYEAARKQAAALCQVQVSDRLRCKGDPVFEGRTDAALCIQDAIEAMQPEKP